MRLFVYFMGAIQKKILNEKYVGECVRKEDAKNQYKRANGDNGA